jgi:glycine oxidase
LAHGLAAAGYDGGVTVVVIGAGLIGSSIAWRVAQRGRRVVLLDRGEPAAEASSAAGGVLIPEAGGVSPPLLALYLRSLAQYAAFVQEVRETTAAAVEYRAPGRLVLAFEEAEETALRRHGEVQRAAGIRVDWLSADDARRLEPSLAPDVRGALFFVDHSLVDNQRLGPVVAHAAARAGAELHSHEAVLQLALEGGRVVGVETVRGRIAADRVVLAAGCWSSQLTPWLRDATGPSKGEMIALQATPRPLERIVSISGASVAPRGDGRLLVGATRTDWEHSRDVTADAVALMLARARRMVPSLGTARFAAAWAGLRPLTPDHEPILGPDRAGGLLWAAGHLGMGILSAPATADLVADLIDGRPTVIPLDRFSPDRFERSATPV